MRRLLSRSVLGTLAVLVILVMPGPWRPWVFGVGHAVVDPASILLRRLGETIGGSTLAFFRVATLTRRVRELEQEISRRNAELSRFESIGRENAELRRTLRLLPRDRYPLVAADVIGPSTDGVTLALRVNRGMRDGVVEGAPVIAAEGIVVGRVARADASSAVVDLLAGGRVNVTVRALATGAEGIVRGLRGLDVLLENVPRTHELRPQDRLVTTGTDGVFPPHLLVGSVKAVRAPENAVFQEASVQLPLDPAQLRVIAIIVEE